MRLRLSKAWAAALVLALGLAAGPLRSAQAADTLIFAHVFPEDSLQQKALLKARAELLTRTGGQVVLDIVPRGLLGNQDTRLVEAVGLGKVAMTFAGGPYAAVDYPPIGLLSAPFGFRDFEHWRHFRDSPLFAELAAAYEKASGMVVVGYHYYGVRQVNARRPLLQPQDLAGLKIRVPNAPVFLQTFRKLGADPVPLPIGQTSQALKSGLVDAEENPLPTIESFKLYEAAPYVMLTGHITDSTLIVIGKADLERLPPAHQRILREVFAKMADELSTTIRDQEIAAVERLKKAGVHFVTVDRTALAATLRPLTAGTAFSWSGDLFQRLQDIR